MWSPYFLLFCIFLLAATPTSSISVPGPIPGTTSHYAQVGGNLYYYIRSRPSSTPKATILLLHGYPDFSYGWRHQIPHLTSLGYQVIAPDMLGYADTDSPAEGEEFAQKKLSSDMALLMDQIVPGEQVIIGGHDWGANLAYKIGVWYPDLFKAMFTISVPYWPPRFGLSAAPFLDVPQLIQNPAYATLGYQLQWREFGFERMFTNETEIYWLLNAAYEGAAPNNQTVLSPYTGWNLSLLPETSISPLVNGSEMDYYVKSFAKKGFRGPNNWYRTFRLDWEDELEVARAANGSYKYHMPTLFIGGSKDAILPPRTWPGMNDHFDNLTMRAADTGHWTMQEAPGDVNRWLQEWLSGL